MPLTSEGCRTMSGGCRTMSGGCRAMSGVRCPMCGNSGGRSGTRDKTNPDKVRTRKETAEDYQR
ncbi:hypothetical protein C8R48DRAFT_731552 [Suillus tomentosus]|nr:hypothetical protein C8R48DRAFT_731552 [Suillus tomentosus]